MFYLNRYGEWGGRELHASAVMPISSISKTITAVAVLQLVESGDIKLSDKVCPREGGLRKKWSSQLVQISVWKGGV